MLLIIPALVVVLGLLVSSWMGPFWVFPRYDPDYCYLLNGLNIAQGARPWHADHPGTPVQMLVALVILVSHTLSGADQMAAEVIARPERYLHASHLAILIFTALSSAALGRAALRATGSVPGALCTQLMGIAALPLIEALARVNPEPALLTVGLLLGAACIGIAGDPAGTRARSLRWSLALGLLVGVGIAVKITFAPVALVGLAMVRGVRQWAVLGAASAAAFALATLPIWYRWEYILNWVRSNAQNAGRYGSGNRPHGTYTAALMTNLRFEAVLPALLAVAVAVVVLIVARRIMKRSGEHSMRLAVSLAALCAAQVAIVLVMSKFPEPRYLVPALALMPLGFVLLWMLAARAPGTLVPALTSALAIGAIAAAMWSGWRLSSAAQTLCAARDAALHAEAVTDGYRDGNTIVYYYSTSGEPGALLFSSHWSANRHADLIVRRFPATLYRLGRGAPYRKGSQRLTADDLRPSLDSGNLFFRAGPNHRPEEFRWQTILAGREGLHRALSPDEAPSPD